ncbi:Uncharacterised protein [uncultured archaeon]|nr:Uncharacterised protein [uncultured archaeon]
MKSNKMTKTVRWDTEILTHVDEMAVKSHTTFSAISRGWAWEKLEPEKLGVEE